MSADKARADRRKGAKRKAKLKQERFMKTDRRRRTLLRRGQKGGRRG